MRGEHSIPVPVTKKNPYSSDENLLHISFEGGILEDPWNEPDEEMFKLSVSPEKAPDTPTYIEMEFAQGTPVAIDGKRLGPVELMTRLNHPGWRKRNRPARYGGEPFCRHEITRRL